jgi:ribonuclease R
MPKPQGPKAIVGIIIQEGGRLSLKSCSKKGRADLYSLNSLNDAKEGDVVVANPAAEGRSVDVKRILGQKDTPGIFSLISLYERGLSDVFSEAAKKEAQSLAVPTLEGREDLRHIPLVTVDGPDTRDFDDAIFAEDTPDGGKHLIVAIADVSWYVRPGSALDKDALQRGNSTYFPDRAIPMLPQELSNGLCSLKPGEDRASMVAHLWIDKDGNLTGKKVNRALIRSAARLTYAQLQDARDGRPDAATAPLMDTVVNPLYEAYQILRQARVARGALELNRTEYVINVSDEGVPVAAAPAGSEESHKVIEEFMVLANVAVAQALEEKGAACVYRNHDVPPYQDSDTGTNRIAQLREYLSTFGITLPEGAITEPQAFKGAIEKARELPQAAEIIKAISRVQAKAAYGSKNGGHFGLALTHYAHFTSPIRRYADLLNHRSLTEAFNLGAGGISAEQKARLEEMAEHINETEILSARAEQSAQDRFAADYLSRQGADKQYEGYVSGIIGGGLFVKLNESGCQGLLPVSRLPGGRYNFDKEAQTLSGKGGSFRPGDKIKVRVTEADGLTGNVMFAPANDNSGQQKASPDRKKGKSRRNGSSPRR